MDEFIATFHIDWKLMLAQIINFGLVFLALYMLAAKPLKKLIDERTAEINTGLLNAKENAEILKATEKEYKETMLKAKSEADVLFKEVKKEALTKKTEMLDQTKKEISIMIENGKKALEAEKMKMVNEAKNEIASLALLAAQKIMQNKNK